MCKNAQNCGKTGVFTLSVSNLQHEGQNRGFGKKAKICFSCRTHHHFGVFWCRASFSQKKVFPKSTKFRWNHWKRSAKLARPQNAIFAPKGPKWAILVRAPKRSRYICRCILLPFPYIFKKTRTIVWYFLLFPFLTTSHFPSFNDRTFLCNKYLSFWSWFWSMFLCSCWLCLFFFVGASASDSPSSFLFSFFNLVFFFFLPVVFLLFWVVCLLVLVFSSPPLASFPSLVFSSLHNLCYFVFSSFPASLHVSRLIVLAVVVLVIIPPLSQLVFLLLPSPPTRIWTGKHWTKKQIILFAYRRSLRKCPFTESLFLFSVVDFFHPQNMFLFHVLGISFEGVRDSLLLHICFFCVWCLAHNLLSVQLVSCACILWIRCLLCSSSSFFLCFCLWCFCYGFWFVSCQFLSSSWDCLSLIALSWCCFFYFVSWLLVCVCVFSWAAFSGEPSRKVVWVWPTGRGQYTFRVFS